jgi:hypothetical protein
MRYHHLLCLLAVAALACGVVATSQAGAPAKAGDAKAAAMCGGSQAKGVRIADAKAVTLR